MKKFVFTTHHESSLLSDSTGNLWVFDQSGQLCEGAPGFAPIDRICGIWAILDSVRHNILDTDQLAVSHFYEAYRCLLLLTGPVPQFILMYQLFEHLIAGISIVRSDDLDVEFRLALLAIQAIIGWGGQHDHDA